MKKHIVDSMSDAALTPTEYITLMFERTDEDGIEYAKQQDIKYVEV